MNKNNIFGFVSIGGIMTVLMVIFLLIIGLFSSNDGLDSLNAEFDYYIPEKLVVQFREWDKYDEITNENSPIYILDLNTEKAELYDGDYIEYPCKFDREEAESTEYYNLQNNYYTNCGYGEKGMIYDKENNEYLRLYPTHGELYWSQDGKYLIGILNNFKDIRYTIRIFEIDTKKAKPLTYYYDDKQIMRNIYKVLGYVLEE